MTDQATNVFNNLILPYDLRKTGLVLGCAQLVLLEVTVSKIIRKILGMGNRSVTELAAIHTVSLPLLGGLSGFVTENSAFGSASWGESLQDGAKGVPAVFAGQYITNTFLSGFHMPKISFKDALITAASKALTRPLLKLIYGKLPAAIQQNFQLENRMEQFQNRASNLKMPRT